jgi:hypothetical protein
MDPTPKACKQIENLLILRSSSKIKKYATADALLEQAIKQAAAGLRLHRHGGLHGAELSKTMLNGWFCYVLH